MLKQYFLLRKSTVKLAPAFTRSSAIGRCRGWLVLLLLVGLRILPAQAQTFGNEWINYSQTYYKIPVVEKGVYHLTTTNLAAAGFPVGSVNPKMLQLFFRGKEQAILVNGEADERLDDGDYVEFLGQGNDGTQDSLLYIPSIAQPHKYYNLYSDTAAYFLTWRLDNLPGKRMANFVQANVANLPAEPYHRDENMKLFTNDFSGGQNYPLGTNQETQLSQYDNGEGWTSTLFNKASNLDLSFNLPRSVSVSGLKPRVEILLVGRNNKNHNVEFFAGASTASLRSLGSTEYQYLNKQFVTRDLDPGDVSATGDVVIRIRANGYADEPNDRNSVCYVRILYPQTLDMTGSSGPVAQKYFYLVPNAGNRSYVEILNPVAGIRLYDVTDPNNVRTIGGSLSNGKYAAIVNNTLSARTILANTTFLAPLPMRRVGFRNINPASHNYLVVSHKALMKPAGGFPDAVRAYAGYRASAAGGHYDTLVVDMDLLCNQFNYGEFSPLAIRRFADFMLHGGKPQYLFLIGRSWYPFYSRKHPFRYDLDLVPTAGYPGSDVMLTAGLNGNSSYIPAIATGRLNIPSGVVPNYPTDNQFNHADPQEVIYYLNKVKEHEAGPPQDLWRKNLLHLSGGHSPNELTIFKQFVNDFKSVAEGSYLGGKVATISKKTDNVVEFINVVEEVNKGLGVLTFFGHSAANITDIDVGFVSNDLLGFHNKGKYPFVLINGCQAGDIFDGSLTFGSDWIKTPDRGAVLVLAHSHIGYAVPLKSYSDQVYGTAFGDSAYIYKPFGLVQREIIRRYTAFSSSEYDIANAQQLTLQGDPAVGIFPAKKPDYTIDDSRLFLQSYDNTPITAVTDSFRVGIVVANYGITDSRPLGIAVKRTLGNGTVLRYDTLFYPSVAYQDTLYFNIKNRSTTGVSLGGTNRFEIKVDPADVVAELNENNNVGTLEYLIPTQGVLALFPHDYSIVHSQTNNIPSVSLIVQNAEGSTTGNTSTRNYLFELDTTSTYNSPGKRSQTVSADFLATWNTTLLGSGTAHDSTVYYWRVRFADRPEGEDNVWAERSFVYITNSPEGWSQSRFPQFSKSNFSQIQRNQQTTRWEYQALTTQLSVQTPGGSVTDGYIQTQLLLNGLPVLSAGKCGANALVGVAFNQATALPYSVNEGLICNNSVPYVANFMYDANITNANNQLAGYIDAVPTGDYVLLFTLGTVSFNNWTPALRQKLVDIGANSSQIAQLQNGHPYIILGKKGAASGQALVEALPNYSAGSAGSQTLNLTYTLNGKYTNGTITSSLIGPASEWGSVFRKVVNVNAGESWSLEIIGVDAQGGETLVQQGITADSYSLAGVDAHQYPHVRLRLRTADPTGQLPPQLRRWQVIYQGVPEGIVNPDLVAQNEYKIADKQEGENFKVNFVFQNISTRTFEDSLTFRYTLLNKATGQQKATQFKVKKLAPGDTTKVTLPVTTLGRAGDNVLSAFFNPRLLPEEYYENNVVEVPFRVKRDQTNPVLDVAFDGVRIMNGDIVSPSPLVSVSLKDENTLLIRKDTVGMEIFVKKPGTATIFEKISLSSPDIQYFPAQAGKNDFRLEYHPRNLSDGVYTLRVQGSDVTGNVSGIEPYQITFEVVNESKVTHFYPYPNPFSTKTRFVFTLTGAQIPDQIKIQIMTPTGRVVREITQQELGPIHVGNNVTDFAWDGTDEFGDKLANGVYLYRVMVRSNGQDIERRTTAADKSFHKEWGKMYILR